ncbi:MAG: hypothetical protein K2I30_06640 [Clostridia bacterium]|nr:hypothetical protein [Clostridia bacterium]
MGKTVKFDLSCDRLIGIASDLTEDHNYIGALKMLNKNSSLHCNDGDSYMLYAEIYDDIGLHEKCVNSWFKFIDCTQNSELSEAYEGLAVAYMNLGNEHFSAYYYNKLLQNDEELDAETRGEIINSFLSNEPNPLKFVYPPKIADYSDVMAAGVEKMRTGEYERAVEEFEKVDEENPAYLSARNYIAMCDIICDKCDEAEAECLALLEKHPDNVQALTTLAAVRTEQKNSAESRRLAKELLSLNVTSTDEIYKIATVCCENKMHTEAYSLFCRLEDELFYDSSLLYFKAVSAYNSGKFEESYSAFDRLLTVYPDAVTAQFNYQAARKAQEDGEPIEMSYFCRLPKEEREKNLTMLAAFAKLSRTEAKKLFDLIDVSDSIRWCFDETDGVNSEELQFLASECAVKAGLDGILCDVLLNAFVSDALKVHILTLLGERNEDNSFGVVICNIYKRVSFRALQLGRSRKRGFISAYARLVAHFSIIEDSYGEEFALACERLYNELEEKQRLSFAADADALAAAIYLKSGITETGLGVTRENLCTFFDTTEEKLNRIIGENL